VSVHGAKRREPFSINSESRDTPAAKRIRAAADRLDRKLSEADDEELDRLARDPAIGRRRGPHHLDATPPSTAAITLATSLAHQAIRPLTAALRAREEPPTIGNGWIIGEPVEDIGVGAMFGIPLLLACSPDTMFALSRMRIATGYGEFEQVKEVLSIRLTELIEAEHDLWDMAYEGPGFRLLGVIRAVRHWGQCWAWARPTNALVQPSA
jgi:hypothetical protein